MSSACSAVTRSEPCSSCILSTAARANRNSAILFSNSSFSMDFLLMPELHICHRRDEKNSRRQQFAHSFLAHIDATHIVLSLAPPQLPAHRVSSIFLRVLVNPNCRHYSAPLPI